VIALELLMLLFCLVGAAFFAGIETGIISINRLRLQHLVRRNVPGAKTIRHFLTHSDLLLGTTLVGTNLLHVVSAVLAASIGQDLGGAAGATAAGVAMLVVTLVCCEYVPKAWFQAAPARRTLPLAHVLRAAAWALLPATFLVNLVVRWLLPRRDAKEVEDKLLVNREELLHLTREGEQSGVLTKHESEMIHGVFELTHKTCDALMTPRDKMPGCPRLTPPKSSPARVRESPPARLRSVRRPSTAVAPSSTSSRPAPAGKTAPTTCARRSSSLYPPRRPPAPHAVTRLRSSSHRRPLRSHRLITLKTFSAKSPRGLTPPPRRTRVFHGVEKPFPQCGKNRQSFSLHGKIAETFSLRGKLALPPFSASLFHERHLPSGQAQPFSTSKSPRCSGTARGSTTRSRRPSRCSSHLANGGMLISPASASRSTSGRRRRTPHQHRRAANVCTPRAMHGDLGCSKAPTPSASPTRANRRTGHLHPQRTGVRNVAHTATEPTLAKHSTSCSTHPWSAKPAPYLVPPLSTWRWPSGRARHRPPRAPASPARLRRFHPGAPSPRLAVQVDDIMPPRRLAAVLQTATVRDGVIAMTKVQPAPSP
jgi:hypothetical protein